MTESQRSFAVVTSNTSGKKKKNRKTIPGLRRTIQSCKKEEKSILSILDSHAKSPFLPAGQKQLYESRFCELVSVTIPKLQEDLQILLHKKKK